MKTTILNNNNYLLIPAWAINKYNLKGIDLQIFSLIYGFTQDQTTEENWYTGSISYMVAWTATSKSSVLRSLKSLVALGLLEKKEYYENNVKFCKYRTILLEEFSQNDED